jgi:hypothetical protein
MQNRHLLLIFLILVSVFLTLNGCSEEIVITPTQEEFDKDLVGCWQLIQSDELFEGDLFVTLDGNAVEYAVVGQTFQENHYDFLEFDYSLIDDKLMFDGKVYQRNNVEPMESPCEYFPDEGMVKVFLVNDGFCFCIKTLYDKNKCRFIERRSIWSSDYGFERDSLEYLVEEEFVYIDARSYLPLRDEENLYWAKWFDEFGPMTRYIFRRKVISDTTFAIGTLHTIDVIDYSWRDNDLFELPMLECLRFWKLITAYFAPDLGPVLYEYGVDRLTPIENRAELLYYYNPVKSDIAYMARRDYRYVQRAN